MLLMRLRPRRRRCRLATRTGLAVFAGAIDAILRQPVRVTNQLRRGGKPGLVATFVLVAVLAGVIYGLVIGMFSGGDQLWAAPIKVAAGFLLSGGGSFYETVFESLRHLVFE